jgi:hypothetical protein
MKGMILLTTKFVAENALRQTLTKVNEIISDSFRDCSKHLTNFVSVNGNNCALTFETGFATNINLNVPFRCVDSSNTTKYLLLTGKNGDQLTFAGDSISASNTADIKAIAYGDPLRIIQFDLHVSGKFAEVVNSTGLLQTLENLTFYYKLGNARLVEIQIMSGIADSGTAQPEINILKNGTAIFSNPFTVTNTPTIIYPSGGTITFSRNDIIDVSLVSTGENGDAGYLTIAFTLVVE